MGYYGKEVEPKGAKASDRSGEKKISVSKVDREMGGVPSTTGAKAPKGATSSDMTGERKAPIAGGVGMGKADGIGLRESSHMGMNDGRLGEMKGHMGEKVIYDHKRMDHDQDGM
ncbi:hypothetical protein [Caudoviricetes sp.]|nr:hypothetical protein [Caudoviricetes sp.]